jgi:hypothetical protein
MWSLRHSVSLGLAQAQHDLLLVTIQPDDLRIDPLARLEHLRDPPDPIPRQLGDVDQALGAADVHEGAIAGQAGDCASDHVTHPEPTEQLLEPSLPSRVSHRDQSTSVDSDRDLFQASDARIILRLAETRTFGNGVVLLRYLAP